jgi:phosphoketolase
MSATDQDPLSGAELDGIDARWRAANYLSVGQIHLTGNSLLSEPLRPEHVKPQLLGHFGTTVLLPRRIPSPPSPTAPCCRSCT